MPLLAVIGRSFQLKNPSFISASITSKTSLRASISTSSFVKPAKVLISPLPRVYVYDHCPFCVRVRLALGIKNIKHEIRFLANDDVQTPTGNDCEIWICASNDVLKLVFYQL